MGRQSYLAWTLITVGLLLSSGCVDEHADSGDSVGETSEPVEVEQPCLECLNQAWACECKPLNGNDPTLTPEGYFCWSGPSFQVEAACDFLCGGMYITGEYTYETIEMACATVSPTCCEDWMPRAAVTRAGRAEIYEVDLHVFEGLVVDPSPIWGCDVGRIVVLADGGFEIQAPGQDDLLYHLGLRDGDLVVALNGYDLVDYGDVLWAFSELWLRRGETNYELTIEREGQLKQLEYLLIARGEGAP